MAAITEAFGRMDVNGTQGIEGNTVGVMRELAELFVKTKALNSKDIQFVKTAIDNIPLDSESRSSLDGCFDRATTGVAQEVLPPNGVVRNPDELVGRITQLITNPDNYDSEKISETGHSQAPYRREVLDAKHNNKSPNLASVAVMQIKSKTDKWKTDQQTKALAIGDWGECKAGRCTTCANNIDGACG